MRAHTAALYFLDRENSGIFFSVIAVAVCWMVVIERNKKKTFKEMRSTDTMYVSYLKDYGPGGKWIVIIWTAEMIILYI